VASVDLSREAAKFLDRLPPKHGRQVAARIVALGADPFAADTIQMKGAAAAFRRADIGEYRIIYRVAGAVLKVVLFGRRNDADVYRRLGRKP
jgi:mRNA interferase RelE/StbE